MKAYSADSTYPDLYCYFDAGDETSPINHFAKRAFTAYPADLSSQPEFIANVRGLPAAGIRGHVLVFRLEPPTRTVVSGPGPGVASPPPPPSGAGVGEEQQTTVDKKIGVEELRSTLLYYLTHDAAAVARERDMQRTFGEVSLSGGQQRSRRS